MDDILNDLSNVNDSSVPPWAKVIINSMVIVINELKCVKELSKRLDELESYRTVTEKITDKMQTEIQRLNERLKIAEDSLDDQEQRNRNFCLLLHGIEENDNEDTNHVVVETINNNLGLEMKIENLQRSHRLGPRENTRNTRNTRTKPRAIIFRFRDFSWRKDVFYAKKKLKGKGISISENLTKRRYALYKNAINKFGFGNVWTVEGRIKTKINKRTVVISSEADIV